MRCLTLARALRARGHDCHFVMRALSGHQGPRVASEGFALTLLPPPSGAVINGGPAHADWAEVNWEQDADETAAAVSQVDWLVLDHYAFDRKWEKTVLPQGARLCVIDDLADRAHACDLLLDQNLGRRAEDYDPHVPARAARLIGPRHALLRPEFALARDAALAARTGRGGRLRHILITMGGVDADNATGAVLAAVAQSGLKVTVVLGSAAPALEAVKAQAATMQGVRILVDVPDMSVLMAEADLAIGATGGTAWERCVLGLPTLMLVLADNQAPAAQALAEVGAGVSLGRFDEPGLGARLAAALAACAEPGMLLEMSRKAASVCDGSGTARVVSALEAPTLRLRPATMADAEAVWNWRRALPAHFFRAGATPGLQEHLPWFAAALADPGRLLLMAEEEELLGHLRLDLHGEEATVSILLSPDARGQGYGLRLLALLEDVARKRHIRRLQALVQEDNSASRRAFTRAGYQSGTAVDGFVPFTRTL